jgi:AraC-like DNA-binding protein/mannose-6-phosphate isomerase-like protein (cupin superfamily)
MNPSELDKKLFLVTEHELQYNNGISTDYLLDLPVVMKDGKEVIKLPELSHSKMTSEYTSSPLIVKKHSRFQQFPLHFHSWIEFIYVYSGSCNQIINDEKYHLTAGQTLLLDSDTIHTIEPLGEEDILINILLKKEYLNSEFFSRLSSESILTNFFLNSIMQGTLHNNFLFFQSDKSRRLPIFMKEFLCEWFDPSLVSTDILNSLFTLIISELMNVYKQDLDNSNNIIKKNSIIPMLSYIEKNYKTCTLNSTALFFNMNANYLSNLLKKHTGYSFKTLVQQKKIKYSEQLLKNTDLTINEIANLAGYENVSFFYKKFQEQCGCLPGEYRNKYTTSINHFI